VIDYRPRKISEIRKRQNWKLCFYAGMMAAI
jgi:hypothetical protein